MNDLTASDSGLTSVQRSILLTIHYYRAVSVRGAKLQWFDLNHLQVPALTFK